MVVSRFTEKGITAVKQGPSRIDALKKDFQAKGAEIREFYLLMGRYDTMLVVEAPNDETLAQLMPRTRPGRQRSHRNHARFQRERVQETGKLAALTNRQRSLACKILQPVAAESLYTGQAS